MGSWAPELETPTRAIARRPSVPLAKAPVLRARAEATAYEAGAQTRRTLRWNAPTTSANAHILQSLTTLRDRSRAAARNDGYAGGALDKLVSNIVGTGIKPQSMAADVAFRALAHAKWLEWTDESDADGLLDWYGQEAQATRCWLEAGESFVRMRSRLASDGLSVPLQVQVLEPELCPHTHNGTSATGNRIRAGIEFDAIGRRVAYYFHPVRPGALEDFDVATLTRVSADSVVHLYHVARPGQLRGVPHLTPALIRLFELDKLEDAVLLRHQLQNMFMAFLTRQPAVGGDDNVHPLTGEPLPSDANDRPMLTMEPGTFNELEPGEDVSFSEPPEMSTAYPEFMRQQLLGACAAHGVPYETLTGDMSKVNDRTVRVILQEFRRRIQMWQHQVVVHQLCRRVWRAWMDRAFLADALPIPADYVESTRPWLDVKWQPQAWPYLHPVQDVQATKEAIRIGITSRTAAVAERGEDAEVVDAEQAADNARADRLGVKYDSDGRNGKASAAPPAATPSGEDPTADPAADDDPTGATR
ncbi:MAG: phage portal protein [Vicinamibacterales bacterium]